MAYEDNLIPQSERTKDEQRSIAREGGKASGKARREKKAMKETLETLLTMNLQAGTGDEIEAIQSIAELKGKNISVQEAIMLAQIKKAMKGDTRAAEFVRDASGNKLAENVALTGSINNPLADLTTEELKKLIKND